MITEDNAAPSGLTDEQRETLWNIIRRLERGYDARHCAEDIRALLAAAPKAAPSGLTDEQRAQIEEAICSLEHAGFKHEPENLRALLAASSNIDPLGGFSRGYAKGVVEGKRQAAEQAPVDAARGGERLPRFIPTITHGCALWQGGAKLGVATSEAVAMEIADALNAQGAAVWGTSTLADLDAALDGAHELSGPPHERISELIRQRDEARAKAEQAPVADATAPDECAAFEAWARSKSMDLTPFEGTYDSDFTSNAWDGWQARAALQPARASEASEADDEPLDIALAMVDPCPFCGSANVDPKGWTANDGREGPACDECGATAETVEGWNRRASEAGEAHPDDVAVDAFAAALKEKLAQARAKGRGGWQQCDPAELSIMLREHVEKGDPRDVANFCMFLWHHGKPIGDAVLPWGKRATAQQAVTLTDDALDAVRYRWMRDRMMFSGSRGETVTMTFPLTLTAVHHDIHTDWHGERFDASVDATIDAALQSHSEGETS